MPGQAAVAQTPIAAVVLAGGSARRLGGVDKLALPVGGRPLLDRVLEALAELGWPVTVAGPRRVLSAGLPDPAWLADATPDGGPAAALGSVLRTVEGELVAVLAGDLPHLRPDVLRQLAAAAHDGRAHGHGGALAVDDTGRDQHLLGVWSTPALRDALAGARPGSALHRLLAPLDPVRLPIAGDPPPWADCDTPAELAAARAAVAPDVLRG